MQDWTTFFQRKGGTDHATLLDFLKLHGFTRRFKVINVVGTNGKGSVSSFLAQGLMSHGYKVGLFTSPHLVSPLERIKINMVEIDMLTFDNLYVELALSEQKTFGFFETLLVIALVYFARQNCEYVVLEAGIGGARDKSALFRDAEFGLVTSISLDHQELLGQTHEAIASAKSSIICKGMHFYMPSTLPLQLRQFFVKDEANTTLIANEGLNYDVQNRQFAIGILKCWGILFSDFQALPGRTQVVQRANGSLSIFDVAHNEDGVKKSLELIRSQNIIITNVLLCLKHTKQAKPIINLLKSFEITLFQPTARFYSAQELKLNSVVNVEKFYDCQSHNTLYIGSFVLIGRLIDHAK